MNLPTWVTPYATVLVAPVIASIRNLLVFNDLIHSTIIAVLNIQPCDIFNRFV